MTLRWITWLNEHESRTKEWKLKLLTLKTLSKIILTFSQFSQFSKSSRRDFKKWLIPNCIPRKGIFFNFVDDISTHAMRRQLDTSTKNEFLTLNHMMIKFFENLNFLGIKFDINQMLREWWTKKDKGQDGWVKNISFGRILNRKRTVQIFRREVKNSFLW